MKFIFPLAIVAIMMTGCRNSRKTQENHKGHDQVMSAMPSASAASVNLKDDKLNAVYQHYVDLTKSLTDGNAAAARLAALAIETGAKRITGGAKLTSDAAEITLASDIAAQRKSFASLTDNLISLLKETGLDSGKLYVSHCPMALNDKGAYWVSNSKEIRNPYFGENMLNCGSVKEVIN